MMTLRRFLRFSGGGLAGYALTGGLVAVLALTALILLGGLFPQVYIESRHRAAGAALSHRAEGEPPGYP